MFSRIHTAVCRGVEGTEVYVETDFEIRKDRFEKIKNSDILEALKRTIYDLKHGYLNICAGSGRDTAIFTEKSQEEHK